MAGFKTGVIAKSMMNRFLSIEGGGEGQTYKNIHEVKNKKNHSDVS